MRALAIVEMHLPDTPEGHSTFRRICKELTVVGKGHPIEVETIHLTIEPLTTEVLKLVQEENMRRLKP